ncbi:hypothetical protein NX059_005834 [Plenodomus lindquistii]|nr:hypothetical protein NX059_005834 [Plenodomus lindquistii]
MRAKRKNVCQDCRSRKLACDGKQPACSQCVARKIMCSGYRQEYLFVEPNSKNAVSRRSPQKPPASNDQPPTPLAATKDTTLRDDIRCILQQYTPGTSSVPAKSNPHHNQICGSWVEVLGILPDTAIEQPCLSSAIRLFSTAVRSHIAGAAVPAHPAMLEMYCQSLRLLKEAIHGARGKFDIAHCVSIMCLAVTDIITPGLDSGWHAHVGGIGKMIERKGPLSFSSGEEHTIFVGLRPLLLVSSILRRRGIFLMEDTWTMIPFVGQPVSIMQNLLNKALKLPSLLERFDQLGDLSTTMDLTAIDQIEADFHDFLAVLRQWELTSQSQPPYIMYWTRPYTEKRLFSDHVLWFPNIMTASSMTHYWAFRIIAKKHITALRDARLAHGHENYQNPACAGDIPILTLAGMICDSMQYLMQPEHKLPGPGSTFFTFATAIRTFDEAIEDCRERRDQCVQIQQELESRGMYVPDIAMGRRSVQPDSPGSSYSTP